MEIQLPDDKNDSFIMKLKDDFNPKSVWEKLNENPEQRWRFHRETLSETNLKDLEKNRTSAWPSIMEENHSLSSTPTATEEEGKFKSINKLTIGLLGAGNEEFMTDPFFE